MKEDLKRGARLLAFFFEIALCAIAFITIVKIILAQSVLLDKELFILMLFIFVITAGMIIKNIIAMIEVKKVRVAQTKSEIPDQPKKEISPKAVTGILLGIPAACICMLLLCGENFGLKMLYMMVGTFSCIIFGTRRAIAVKNSGKWKRPNQLRGIIGWPASVYMIIYVLLIEYVVG